MEQPLGGFNLEKGNCDIKKFRKAEGRPPADDIQNFEIELKNGKFVRCAMPEEHFFLLLKDQGHELSAPDDEHFIHIK